MYYFLCDPRRRLQLNSHPMSLHSGIADCHRYQAGNPKLGRLEVY